MSPTLPPTNMTAEEMIPDTLNPTHDLKFWCLPPVRDQASERQNGRYPMYLVTQGRTVVKAMVSGHQSGPDTPNSPHPDAPIPQQPPPPTAIVTAVKEKTPAPPERAAKGKARQVALGPWDEVVVLCTSQRQLLYVKKYGYHLADDQDLAEDVEDPPDEAADEVVHERIGAWYRAQYGSLLKSDKTAFQELFTGILDGAPPKPQRGRLLHFYSRKFYDTRIKEDIEECMVALTRRAELVGEAPPIRIDVIAKVTAECWEQETAEFQRDCEFAMEREYQQAVKGWEASLSDSPTRTAEEIASTFANAVFYLQPFIDAIQQRFGMCATVLLAGPIGE
ncbi:hypothetical protein B0H14DRAFT_3474731 [Mycena olivaceomarginata]|nr:hypothetical protein B0H14DRAFT_3474731 [Mycena olivaceomarginata]